VSVQLCEGVWRSRCGVRVEVTQCEPVDGQRWTDGAHYYSDNGSFWDDGRESKNDLVAFVGPLPDQSQGDQTAKIELLRTTLTQQTAEIDRLRIELQETYAGWSDSISALAEQTVEIDRLKAELQRDFATAQQLRADNESLTVRLQRAEVVAAETLQKWETTEQVCLKIITELVKGVRS